MTDDTKQRLAELAARAEAATAAVVRPTDAELGQARVWAERVGHRWNARAGMAQEDAKTIARVLSWLLAERAVLRTYHRAIEHHRDTSVDTRGHRAGCCCVACEDVARALEQLREFDGDGPQLSLLDGRDLGKEPG